MTTTHLFVELLVIGLGALIWLFLLGAWLFGYPVGSALEGEWLKLETIFPLLTIAYLFGILVDRLADAAFGWWDGRHLRLAFGDTEDDKSRYYAMRRQLVVEAPPLWNHLEYGRSRLRICRGWAINALLIAIFLTADWLTGTAELAELSLAQLIVCDVLLVVLAISCVLAWRELNAKEYLKIDRQAVWLNSRSGDSSRAAIAPPLSMPERSSPALTSTDEEGTPDGREKPP